MDVLAYITIFILAFSMLFMVCFLGTIYHNIHFNYKMDRTLQEAIKSGIKNLYEDDSYIYFVFNNETKFCLWNLNKRIVKGYIVSADITAELDWLHNRPNPHTILYLLEVAEQL